jgi:Rhomboid family.
MSLLAARSPFTAPRSTARTFHASSAVPRLSLFAFPALAALLLQFAGPGALRELLLYDRTAVAAGELWRLWTGHLCHFGWFHALADTGVFLLASFALIRRPQRSVTATSLHALVALPAFIALAIFFLDPAMPRYAGLSGVNVGLLVFLSLDGIRRHRRDWFWPALLVIHAIELLLEHLNGGLGGGAIRFDEPAIRIATIAHLAGAAYGLLWFLLPALSPTLPSAHPAS